MSSSPQDVYARYLLSSRGYPLWVPEPSNQLLLSRPDGLRIGDVGVVVPEDGGFEVFFNICLPREHPFHRASGVPDNFKLVELRDEDIRTIPRIENPGRIISTSSVTKIRKVGPSGNAPGAPTGMLGYEFDLSSSGGALLILPEGAERYDLRNRRLFFEEATRHGADWYRFAEGRLGRMISHDSLYLISGFYKTRSWSVAAFENVAGNGKFSAQFKMGQAGGSNVAGTYTWETTRALDWRAGPVEDNGFANQSVFIRGFKVALRTGFLGETRIEVKADAPSAGLKQERFSHFVKRNSWVSNIWKGFSRGGGSGTDMQDEMAVKSITHSASNDYPGRDVPEDSGKRVVIQSVPDVPEMFHPSDIINQCLFKWQPSANVAVTHDDDWIVLLEKEHLRPEDFSSANPSRVESAVMDNFHAVLQDGVVFLQGNDDATANDDTLLPPHTTLQNEASMTTNEFPGVSGNQDIKDEELNPPWHLDVPPPAYAPKSLDRRQSANVPEKPILSESLDLASTRPLDIHWQLLPYDPRRSSRLLRFDIMFPVDQICYHSSSNIRERLTSEELDEPAFNYPITKMRVTFEQRPFGWNIDVDNPKGIRCRDVFEAIYHAFDQRLTLGELWLVPDRAACEEASRLRRLVLGGIRVERSLGWKRVDVLLHHTIFHGLAMNSDGDWALLLGAPLPVPELPQSVLVSRRNSSSTEESFGSTDEAISLPSPRRFRGVLRSIGDTENPALVFQDMPSLDHLRLSSPAVASFTNADERVPPVPPAEGAETPASPLYQPLSEPAPSYPPALLSRFTSGSGEYASPPMSPTLPLRIYPPVPLVSANVHSIDRVQTSMDNDSASVVEQRASAVAKLRRAASLPRMKDGGRPRMHIEAASDDKKFQAEDEQDIIEPERSSAPDPGPEFPPYQNPATPPPTALMPTLDAVQKGLLRSNSVSARMQALHKLTGGTLRSQGPALSPSSSPQPGLVNLGRNNTVSGGERSAARLKLFTALGERAKALDEEDTSGGKERPVSLTPPRRRRSSARDFASKSNQATATDHAEAPSTLINTLTHSPAPPYTQRSPVEIPTRRFMQLRPSRRPLGPRPPLN